MYESNVSADVPDSDYQGLSLLFEALGATARLTNCSMFVIDFAKKELVFRTPRLKYADNAAPEDFRRSDPNPYWSLIHDEDLHVMIETRDPYLRLIRSLPPEQQLGNTYIIDYRIRLNNRDYVVAQKFTPLKLCPDGSLWLGLFCITESTNKACEHIAVFGDGFRYTYSFKHKSFTPFDEYMELTDIEKAILQRSAKGLTTEQIATELCRSVNTIKTHKRQLFNKLHVTSMREALTFVANYGL